MAVARRTGAALRRRGIGALLGGDRALLRAAFEAAEGALWLVGPDGALAGEAGEAGPAPVASLASLPEPARRILMAGLRDALPARAEAALGAGEACTHWRFHFAPVALGAVAGVLHAADLSALRAAEAQLRQAQRLSSVGELAAGIAHDFNNLLTAIVGSVETLIAEPELGGRGELAQIRESAGRGAALVRQLLAFSRQQTLQPVRLGVDEAVGRAADLLRRLIGGGVELRLELAAPGRRVLFDPTQFDQVLVNLAMNAAQAMRGQGAITISTGRRNVLRTMALGSETVPPGRYVTVEVRDTGPGIAAEILPRIFEPFFTTRRGSGGTGLGLSTVHGIVRQSGGFLAVESVVGEGTCFQILLPRPETEATEAAPARDPHPREEPAPAPRMRSGRVLLVEDEAPVRKLAERALGRAGFTVTACDTARAALDIASGSEAELTAVVSDVVLPGMDGPALVRALRVSVPHLPAVLVSGYADGRQREALAADDIVFLPKPFAMRELVAALERACCGEAAA